MAALSTNHRGDAGVRVELERFLTEVEGQPLGVECAPRRDLVVTPLALSDPALDAVWREISGLVNLMRLLPADLWHAEDLSADSQPTSCMTRETVAADWTRFLAHARRVREFTFEDFDGRRPSHRPPWNTQIFGDNTVLRHLQQQCPEPYILPGLLKLLWYHESPPSLLDTFPRSVELLESKAPIVTSLTIYSPSDAATEVVDAVSLAVLPFDHLSRLPMLQDFGFSLSSTVSSPEASSPTFPGLTELIVRPQCQASLLCSLLEGISSTQLGRIWWQINETDPNGILSVVTVLADHCSQDALESVSISASWELLGTPLAESLRIIALEPLLTLGNLTELHLSIFWLDLGNEDLEEIAINLPFLTTLNLGSAGLVLPCRITPSGLIPLLRHCALKFLGIVVDFGDNVPESEFILPHIRPRALTRNARRLHWLDFGNSKIGTAKIEATAAFLSELVPRVETLTAWTKFYGVKWPTFTVNAHFMNNLQTIGTAGKDSISENGLNVLKGRRSVPVSVTRPAQNAEERLQVFLESVLVLVFIQVADAIVESSSGLESELGIFAGRSFSRMREIKIYDDARNTAVRAASK
ncbi:hypothetical protein C8F04DRAFT_1272300 [Mycena alexandri]|uniref:Uncharacterized protein n=1 Tax=Mycena alexandri TaxID=1745969 RepID=A0AAD6S7L8_9AGAR|nr:hypothetical protein C8F04DRAFT_1272300 [Mycena alexandri]